MAIVLFIHGASSGVWSLLSLHYLLAWPGPYAGKSILKAEAQFKAALLLLSGAPYQKQHQLLPILPIYLKFSYALLAIETRILLTLTYLQSWSTNLLLQWQYHVMVTNSGEDTGRLERFVKLIAGERTAPVIIGVLLLFSRFATAGFLGSNTYQTTFKRAGQIRSTWILMAT